MQWYVWLMLSIAAGLVLALFPLRVGVYAAFSLFDGRAGVRLSLFGLPVLRLWADLSARSVLVNGKPAHPLRLLRGAHGAVSPSRVSAALRAVARWRYAYGIDLLVGTYREEHSWIAPAVCDLLSLPHVQVRAYAASAQVCKGVLRGGSTVCLWQIARAAMAMRSRAT